MTIYHSTSSFIRRIGLMKPTVLKCVTGAFYEIEKSVCMERKETRKLIYNRTAFQFPPTISRAQCLWFVFVAILTCGIYLLNVTRNGAQRGNSARVRACRMLQVAMSSNYYLGSVCDSI